VLRPRQATTRTSVNRPTRIPKDQLPALVTRVEREGLRPVAQSLGVSHETLRATLVAGGYEALLADVGRKRRLASAASPPPPAPRKIPDERYAEVATLCQRHTQAEVAALLGVSQTTVWRIVRRVG
jgi:transposase